MVRMKDCFNEEPTAFVTTILKREN